MWDEHGTRRDATHASTRDNGASGRRETICTGKVCTSNAHGTAVHSERRGSEHDWRRVEEDPVSAVDERLGERGGDSDSGGRAAWLAASSGGMRTFVVASAGVRGADTADFQRRDEMGGEDGGEERPGRQEQQRGQR